MVAQVIPITLNLDAIGLEADHRGQLKVNDRYQTDVEYVYAAGDVIGWPSSGQRVLRPGA